MMICCTLILAAAWFYPQMDLEIYRLNKMWEETDNVGMRAAHPGEVAKSLCHVWSAWPAFLFVSEVMGVKPTSDGWQTYEANPLPGLTGLHATIPTPKGMLEF